jgi:hypothetical protein
MTKLITLASLLALTVAATGCLDHTAGPTDPGGGIFRDGSVSTAWTGHGELHDITVVARDVGGDDTIVNSETYATFDHGFKLDLPGGRYKIEVTDAAQHVLATYAEVVVDGEVTVGAPSPAAQ